MSKFLSRSDIVQEALLWVGTPYRHQASEKMVGCDCLGLVRGVWRAFYDDEYISVPPYTPDWAERGQHETLKLAADTYLNPIEIKDAQAGDVMLFRMQAGVPAKHMAFLLDDDCIVHAYWGRAVTRSFLAPFWIKRRAYAYSFPTVQPKQ